MFGVLRSTFLTDRSSSSNISDQPICTALVQHSHSPLLFTLRVILYLSRLGTSVTCIMIGLYFYICRQRTIIIGGYGGSRIIRSRNILN